MYGMDEEAYVCASSATKFEYYGRDVISDDQKNDIKEILWFY